ncbi:hypothetical protein [Streptomyces sp. Agncl-13]|uniref:hypothetical protein n=1 Tax=Streptomyces sp. Agncl-13 TaxID=3400628 RepID=UPI003A895FD0
MRRGVRIGIGAGVVAALLAAGAGLWVAFAGEGHPFGDARACEGSDVPLRVALDVVQLRLPAGATDVHYVTHSSGPAGEVSLAVAFRVSGRTLDRYLRENKIVPAGVDWLGNGPYSTGDSGADPASLGLCGGEKPITAPSVDIDKRLSALDGSPRSVDLAVGLPEGYGRIPTTTDVLLTVAGTTP